MLINIHLYIIGRNGQFNLHVYGNNPFSRQWQKHFFQNEKIKKQDKKTVNV